MNSAIPRVRGAAQWQQVAKEISLLLFELLFGYLVADVVNPL